MVGPSLGASPNLGRQLGAMMDYHQFVTLSPEEKNAEILKLLPLLSPFAKVKKILIKTSINYLCSPPGLQRVA